MPKPLRLFIRPPYADWTLVHGFGREQLPPPADVFFTYAVLHTTGGGELFAAVEGKLSVSPPHMGVTDPTLPVTSVAAGQPLPATVNLYLHDVSPTVAVRPDFLTRAAGLNQILGFAYLNVETASLETNLAELLETAIVPRGALPRSHVVLMLLHGLLDVRVTAGHAIGVASTQGAPAGNRRVGFTVLTRYGPLDPAHSYDWMRDFIEDGQPDLDALLAKMPKRWPVIDANLSTNDSINLTQSALYPMTVLQHLRTTHNLNAAQWRQVGNNQKSLWRRRLLKRVGHPLSGSTDPTFEFDDLDWRNLFQLEAIVELYANYDDPWTAGAAPRNPGDAGYSSVDFLDLAGPAAAVAGNVATLDGSPDLTRVLANHDTILLESDTGRTSRTYRITAVNNAAHAVTLDASPALAGGTSAWQINLRPSVVIIDPFGGRLSGTDATVIPPNVVILGGPAPDLGRVNPNFDTIYLPSDTGRTSRTYRITAVNDAAHTVTLDANPSFVGGSSAWHIQAGVSGELPTLHYNLGPGGNWTPGNPRGYDHFDGMLFIVKNGEVKGRYRWTSYTSRQYRPITHQFLSSIRGNRSYELYSYRSTNANRNYSFKVTDAGVPDGVREARFYFRTPTLPDTVIPPAMPNGGGKTEIRLHYSRFNFPAGGANSAGCLVSPVYESFRTQMIDLYQDDYKATYGGSLDREVQRLWGRSHAESETLWTANQPTAFNWNDRLRGKLWVIRPNEKPL